MKHIIHQFRTGALFIVNSLKLFTFLCSLFIFSCLLFIAPLSFAQVSPSAGRAAIVHSKFRSAESGGVATGTNAVTTIQYYDGLGNPTQNVGYRMSPTGKDIVLSVTTYDKALRPYRTYLPFGTSGTNGGYNSNPQSAASAFYDDTVPYNEVLRYDYSSDNEPRKTRGPGKAWEQNGRMVTIQNSAVVVVKFITTDASGNLVFNNRYYPGNTYQRGTLLDEQNNSVITVKDIAGKTVLIQDASGGVTHYIYDERDRLSAVIQPQGYDFGTAGITKDSDQWQKYVFGYEYDLRNRIIRKHIPGAGWTEIVYDNADRPVMTQNAAQKTQNKWNFTQYDAFGREIAFGETTKTTTRAAAQTLFKSQAVIHETWSDGTGYSEVSFPAALRPAPVEMERFNFYDTYGFIASEFAYKPTGAFHTPKSSAKGLLTGVSKRNSADDNRYYTDTYYYDDLNRIIQSQHTHQKSTGNQQNVIVRNMEYNFSNEVTKIHTTDPMPTGTVYAAQHNFYDHAGRITRIDYGINTSSGGSASASPSLGGTTPSKSGMYSLGFSQPKNGVLTGGSAGLTSGFTMPTLSKLITYSYDEIGRMTEKRFMPDGTFSLGNPDYIYLPPSPNSTTENKARKAVILEPGTLIEASTGSYLAGIDSTVSEIPPFSNLQQIRMQWHIRGGLRGINLNPAGNPIPDMTKGDLFAYKLDYETAGQWNGNIGRQSWNHIQGTEPVGVRNYQYTFDSKNQIKSAIYSGLTGENYSIPNVNYDKNGNIIQLQRNGKMGGSFGMMDNLSYTYNGNRLTSVNDAVSGDHEVDFVKRGSGAYTYWENGALKSDENKEITNIIYNTFLNLPQEIQLTGERWIKMTYDGSGALIKREFSTGEYWEYAEGFIFKNGQFYSFGIPEGRAVYEGGVWKYEFFYQDHLQNTRVTFRAEGNRLVKKDATDFEPMGTRLNGTGVSGSPENRFKFQNKESMTLFGLGNINDFSARYMDRSIGRFWGPDRKSEEFYGHTPYNHALNNGLKYIDPDGNAPKDIIITLQRNAQTGVTSQVRYYQGNLYNTDGTKYKPDMMGHFASKIQSTLNDIRSSDSYLEKIVSTLESSDAGNHYIQLSEKVDMENHVKAFGDKGSTAMYLRYDSIKDGKLSSGEKSTFGTSMAHELSHQYDRETNQHTHRPNNQQKSKDPNEIRAVNTENRYRESKGIELRTHYGGKIDQSKLEDPKKEKQ
jgi:RHS repeat-associated protein